MKILVLSGSLRQGSFNTALADRIALVRPHDEVKVRNDLNVLPFFNADVEAQTLPPAVTSLRNEVEACQLLVFATPEYNGTTPGMVLNAVEWLSRPHRDAALSKQPTLVLSASPTRGGGRRSAEHLRQVLMHTGADVSAQGMSLPEAHHHLADPESEAGRAVDDELRRVLASALEDAGRGRAMRATG